MLVLSLLACAKQAPAEPSKAPEPTQERAHERKAGAPVELVASIASQGSSITATFTGEGTAVEVQAWGARGLEVAGDKVRWSGDVTAGQQVTIQLDHSSDGALAVRVAGTFAGEHVDEVRSWTIGSPEKTPVPVQGGSKGWDATRR